MPEEDLTKGMPNPLSGYPPEGPSGKPNRWHVHSLPKETQKKVFGIETSHIGFTGQRSSFSPTKIVSTERNQPVGVFAGQGGPNSKLDRFHVHSIPKETMKKVFGIETKHIGYKGQDSTFKTNKVLTEDENCPTGVFAGPGGPNPKLDRFRMHSIPKETMKKVFGIETGHIGYVEPTSSFRPNKFSTAERNQPTCMFGPPGRGPHGDANRFTTDSLSKEVMAKQFGTATAHLGYIAPASSFRHNKFASHERNQPTGVFAKPGDGPSMHHDKFRMHSIPKETMKKVWGLETGQVGFQSLRPTVRNDIGVGFGRSAKTCGSTVTEDVHWVQRLQQEGKAISRLERLMAGDGGPGGAQGSDSDSDSDDDWDGPSINDIGGGTRRRRPRPRPTQRQLVAARAARLRERQHASRSNEARRFVSTLQKLDTSLARMSRRPQTQQQGGGGSRAAAAAVARPPAAAATARPRTSQQRARLIENLRKLERTLKFREGD